MRGSYSPPGRGWPMQQPRNEAISVPYTHPAPYGGWNARGNLATMKAEEAIQLDNIFPGIQAVEMRKGAINWVISPPEMPNGTFTGTTAEWGTRDVTIAAVGNKLQVTKTNGASAGAWAFTVVNLVIGSTYTITAALTSGNAELKVGTAAGAQDNGIDNNTGPVTLSVTFVATAVQTYISLGHPPGVGPGAMREFDNVTFTGVTGDIRTLLPYHGLTTNKLFAASDTAIYDATSSGVFGASVVSGLTNGNWKSLMMATSGGNFMLIANGADAMRAYDGAAWSTPAVTVANSATWNYLTLHKRRVWAVQKDTMDLWYLPVDSIAGAAAKFPVGALFKKGGKIVAIGTWTLDSGQGVDDLFVIVTSNGEIAVYQGTDPASASTWALVAVYVVAKPVGDRPLLDYGGDLLYFGATGVLPLSRLRQSSIVDKSSNISYNVEGAFIDAVESYSPTTGWQMITHESANLLLVNIPIALGGDQAQQFVMNTSTKKWCRFTNWNADHWANFGGELYFCGGNKVCKAWVGTTDFTAAIVGVVRQSYFAIGSYAQKKIELTRLNFGVTGPVSIIAALDADYATFAATTDLSYIPSTAGALWDTGLWDTATWDSGESVIQPHWTTIPNNLGMVHSLRMQITASSGNFSWNSTDFVLKGAGIL